MKFVHVFGFRVMLTRVAEKSGTVIKPQNTKLSYELGRVVAVGDGRKLDGSGPAEEPLVAVNDLVWFQTNDTILQNQSYLDGEQPFLNLHQGDLLARFESPELFYGNMEPLGRWVFVEPYLPDEGKLIQLPESVEDRFFHFRVSKTGPRTDLPLKPGQEVMVNTGRMGTFRMRRGSMTDEFVSYGYVDRDFVLATVDPS